MKLFSLLNDTGMTLYFSACTRDVDTVMWMLKSTEVSNILPVT